MRRFSRALAACLAVACAPPLPSATPLGEGPLAKAEAARKEKPQGAGTVGPAKPEPAEAAPPTAADAAPPEEPSTPEAPPPVPTAEAKKSDAAAPRAAGKKPPAAVVYAGEYLGSDTSSYRLAGMDRDETDDKARTRVDGAGPEISVTFIDSGSGKDICTLKAQMTGKTGTFPAGQRCWGGDGAGMVGTLTRGTASFDDKKLVIDADFDLEVGQGDMKMRGTLKYHFEGTRK